MRSAQKQTQLFFFTLFILTVFPFYGNSWGFFAHRKINRLAVFTLPPEMFGFYKVHIQYLTEESVAPDKRRYVVPEEAARHYIDVDVYGDSAVYTFPRFWKEAVAKYPEDTLVAYGIVPWYIQQMAFRLKKAFQEKKVDAILRLSADIGHYIADANVPLHTTQNYNGQLTGQEGIHGLWESRLPELFAGEYDLFTGRAEYVKNIQIRAWEAVITAHEGVDSVLSFERRLSESFKEGRKFGYEERGSTTTRVYSREFSKEYQQLLHGQVERQMKASIKMIGDIWYTCWINAGQPDLGFLPKATLEVDTTDNEKHHSDEPHH